MRQYLLTVMMAVMPLVAWAQGWPANYDGVMLQGFYWDSFSESRWTVMEKRAEELAPYFSLVWVPQSGNCGGGQSMGYDDLYWFDDYNSSFGTEKELRSMISAFRSKGIKTIADVVINHRKNLSNWVDFPRETYKGETYELLSTDICANDDGGKTKNWATQNGYELSKNNDSGEAWDGMRDLDHYSDNVQRTVKAYLDFLQNDLGYAGFRYDMVKGYAGKFTGIYNAAAKPEFSVGEYWDGNVSAVKGWLDATRVDGMIQSAAFDFPFRYTIRDAVNKNDWSQLDNDNTLAANQDYCRYSVTFVENHDTEYRSATSQNDPIRRDTLAANAYMLAMPGTPCVAFKHWRDYKRDIAKMIKLRKAAGIHSQSKVWKLHSAKNVHAHEVKGTNYSIVCVVGKDAWDYQPPNVHDWHCIAAGYHWAYWTSEPVNLAEPEFPEDTFEPYDITVGVDISQVGWHPVYFWTWGGDGSHAPDNASWPGDAISQTQVVNGQIFYVKKYTIHSATDNVCFVFSAGNNRPQTVDVNYVTTDRWFRVSQSKDGTKHLVDDVTDEVPVTVPKADRAPAVYSLDGRRVVQPKRGLYIVDGKKTIIH